MPSTGRNSPSPWAWRSGGTSAAAASSSRRGRAVTTTSRSSASLNELKRHWGGRRLILIWDGLPSHKSRAMVAYLRAQRSWLTVERLPGYAPDLNPTELVWGNVKGQELANLCADNLGEVERAVRAGLPRVRRAPTLAFAFLRHAGLSF